MRTVPCTTFAARIATSSVGVRVFENPPSQVDLLALVQQLLGEWGCDERQRVRYIPWLLSSV